MSFLAQFINLLFWILILAILTRSILSWTSISPTSPIVKILDQITEPILAPFRRFIPATGSLDFTPFIAIILLDILRRLLISFF